MSLCSGRDSNPRPLDPSPTLYQLSHPVTPKFNTECYQFQSQPTENCVLVLADSHIVCATHDQSQCGVLPGSRVYHNLNVQEMYSQSGVSSEVKGQRSCLNRCLRAAAAAAAAKVHAAGA